MTRSTRACEAQPCRVIRHSRLGKTVDEIQYEEQLPSGSCAANACNAPHPLELGSKAASCSRKQEIIRQCNTPRPGGHGVVYLCKEMRDLIHMTKANRFIDAE
ncbi:hypothetical protein PMIN02_011777 [Paraphaeosphaeria minitans]